MALRLLVADDRSHVSLDAVDEFQSAILASGGVTAVTNRFARHSRVLGKMLRTPPILNMLSRIPRTRTGYFSVLMSADFAKCVPFFFSSRANALYMFDAWPSVHPLIEELTPKLNIRTLFFSSLQATETFSRKQGMDCSFIWIPEGINPAEYRSKSLPERDIDVLQFGRRYDRYHDSIVGPLREAGKSYLFEETKGAIVFATRGEFLDGLSRAKISICIPGNLTHPERSGSISTMTLRYLQSMASGCLIVGVLPYDMQLLFDYKPLIEIDFTDPAGQLLEILRTMDRYQPLIDRNERIVRERHTWSHRWAEIRRLLQGNEEAGEE